MKLSSKQLASLYGTTISDFDSLMDDVLNGAGGDETWTSSGTIFGKIMV